MKLRKVMAQKVFAINLQALESKVTNEKLSFYIDQFLDYKIRNLLCEIKSIIGNMKKGYADNGAVQTFLRKKNRYMLKTICCGLSDILDSIKQGTFYGSNEDEHTIMSYVEKPELLIDKRQPGLSVNNIGNTLDIGKKLDRVDHIVVFMELIDLGEVTDEKELQVRMKKKLDSLKTVEDYMRLLHFTWDELEYSLPEVKRQEISEFVEEKLAGGESVKQILMAVYESLQDIEMEPQNFQTTLDGHLFLLEDGDGHIYMEIAKNAKRERELGYIVENALCKYGISKEIQCNTWEYIAVTSEIYLDPGMKAAIQAFLDMHIVSKEHQCASQGELEPMYLF